MAFPTVADRIRGSLLGGAIGDALGAPVEFHDVATIVAAHGEQGVRRFAAHPDGAPPGSVTDDTQMTLFTAEALLDPDPSMRTIHQAYDRWLDTQVLPPPDTAPDGSLRTEGWLYARRAPGLTCLGALTITRDTGRYGDQAANDSKGCGGVMRVAPIGCVPGTPDGIFDRAAEAAGLTHGHPTGKLASGAFAVLIHRILAGDDLDTALDTTQELLAERKDHEETSTALRAARALAEGSRGTVAAVESLGGGWVAEEALAIAVYAALTNPEPDYVLDALSLAVTHSGDSDSTGAICGNLLGALHGEFALPPHLVAVVEGRDVVLRLADRLAQVR